MQKIAFSRSNSGSIYGGRGTIFSNKIFSDLSSKLYLKYSSSLMNVAGYSPEKVRILILENKSTNQLKNELQFYRT